MNWRRHAWIAVALAATLLGLATAAVPCLKPLDEPLRDLFFAVRGPLDPGPDVVIASVDDVAQRALGPWPWDVPVLGRVISVVKAGNPRAIVLAFKVPPGLERATAGVPLVRARAIEATPLEPRPFRAAEPPAPGAGIDAIPPQGTVRFVPLRFDLEGEPEADSLALAALRASGAHLEVAPDAVAFEGLRARLERGAALRINWIGPPGRFPYLRASRIVEGDLPPGTFAGKIVIFAPSDPAIDDGLATPTTGAGAMPRAEVLANALDTIVRGRSFRPAPLWAVGIVLLSVLFLYAFAFRQVRPIVSFGVTAAVLLASLAGCYLLFRSAVVVPILPFFVGIAAAFAGLAVLRDSEMDEDIETLLDELSRLDKRFYVADEETDVSRWARALDLASLFLDVESLVLFRREPEGPYIKFVAGYKATEADIAERRRDTRRSPYRDAADPLRQVVRHNFMKPELRQASLLVPIAAVTRTLGYLVVNRRQGDEAAFAEQRDLIRFIGQQLGTLVLREELSRRESRTRLQAVAAIVQSDRLARRFEVLSTVSRSILEKKNLLFSTLNAIEDGAIVCDMFGRVVLYNARINSIAERIGTTIEGKNVIDLIHDLSGLDRHEIIRRLAAVVMGEPLLLEVKAKKAGRHYRLALSAVRSRTSAPHAKKEEGPVLGLVALFSDITTLKELDSMKTGLLNMVSYRVLNILTSIQGYAELLADTPTLSAEEREFAETIKMQSMSLTGVFDSFHHMANLDTGAPGAKMAPVDLVALVRRSFDEASRKLEGKTARLEIDAPERFDIVAADDAMIVKALATVFGFAIENAERNTPLKVSIAEEERYLRIDVQNRGFGISAEALPTLFDGGTSTPEREGSNLKVVKDVFELHGGSVKADAVVGEGTRFHLWLPLFMRGADAPMRADTR